MKDTVKGLTDIVAETTGNFYDKLFLDMAYKGLLYGKPWYYRNVRVPKYQTIKVPIIEKDYDEDGDFRGYLITFIEKRLFKIGTEIVKQPIYHKRKLGKKQDKTITFKRYSPLEESDD